MRERVRRRGIVSITTGVAVLVLVGTPTPAIAQSTTCTYVPETATLNVVAEADVAFTASDDAGGAIGVTGADCGAATTSNVDLIDVHVGTGNVISIVQTFGRFAPGMTDEGDGTSEIEFHLSEGTDAPLIIVGTEADDAFATGTTLVAPDVVDGVNLNADDDYDVLISQGTVLEMIIAGEGGEDRFDLTGGEDPPTALPLDVGGGIGADTFRFRGSLGDVAIQGDGGLDRLDLADIASSSDVVVDLRSEDGAVRGVGPFEVFTIEHVSGHQGVDSLLGTSMTQFLFGRGGKDSLFGRTGNDVLDGGLGRDLLNGGPGIDTCRDGGADTLRGCENPPHQRADVPARSR